MSDDPRPSASPDRPDGPVPGLSWEAVVNALGPVVWVYDPGAREMRFVSAAWERTWGRDAADLLADVSRFFDGIVPEDAARIATMMASGEPLPEVIRYRYVTIDGEVRNVRNTTRSVETADGPVVVGSAVDVTEAREDARRATDERELVEALFANQIVGIGAVSDDGTVVLGNDALCTLFGTPRDTLLHTSLLELVHPDDRRHVARRFQDVVRGRVPSAQVEARVVREGDDTVWVEMSYRALEEDNRLGARIIGVVHDVTDRRQWADRIENLALTDTLTGLANRRRFTDMVAKAAASPTPGRCDAVVFMDLDHFKEINDLHGHGAGDALLREVGQALHGARRDGDLIARLGGDEFGALLRDAVDSTEVMRRVDDLLAACRRPFTVSDTTVRTGLSAGVALVGDHGTTARALLRQADAAMYAAKRRGGDRAALYDRALGVAVRQQAHRRRALDDLIDAGRVDVEFEPVVDARTGVLTYAEALVRFREGPLADAAVQDVVSAAETTGQIVGLGRLVLDAAMAALPGLQRRTHGAVRVGVNVSVRQLQDPRFVDMLRERTDLVDLGSVVIEVTESLAMEAEGPALAALDLLRSRGALLAVDDFGTGHSSLARLAALEPDLSKIDRSFLDAALQNPRSAALYRAIVQLGHAVGATVVAEGVADARSAQFAREAGADLLQGHHLDLPPG